MQLSAILANHLPPSPIVMRAIPPSRRLAVALSFLLTTLAHADPALDSLKTKLASTEIPQRREAIYDLSKLGPAAKAALPELIKATDDQDKQVWSGALTIIAELGPEAAEAIPALIEGLDSRKVRGGRERDRAQATLRTAYALAQIGPAALPALIGAMESDNTPRRLGAARALAHLGPSAAPAVDALLKNLGHHEEFVRREVTDALGQIGAPAVPGLTRALTAPEPKQRQAAALALAQIGATAKPAADTLLAQSEKETDPLPRAAIFTALPKVGADPAKTAAILHTAIRGDQADLRHAAVNALLTAPAIASKAVGDLANDLKSPEAPRRQRAAQILGRLGPAAVPAVPALLERAQAEPAATVYAEALAQIGTPALPPLLQALSTAKKGSDDRTWVFRALNEMGAPALSGLAEALRSPTPAVRAGAAAALQGMPLEKHPAVKRLLELTPDPDATVRAASLRTLADVRSERPAIIEKLNLALKDPDPAVRKAAAIGLATAGAVEKLGVDGLQALLSEPDPETQRTAIRALGALGANARPAVPALIQRLSNPEQKSSALEALTLIGPAAAEAVPALINIAGTKKDQDLVTAYPALAAIGAPSAPALPLMYETMRGSNLELHLVTMHAIAKIEPDDARLFAFLTDALKNRSGRMRRGAAEEIRRLGDRARKAKDAIPPLLAMLETPTERSQAVGALRAIDLDDLGMLQSLLNHKEATVRGLASDALGRLGPTAAPALPQLREKAEKDPEEKVRQVAKKAVALVEKK